MRLTSWAFLDKWNSQIKLMPQDKALAKVVIPLVPRFVVPNHLTIMRLLLTPVLIWYLWEDYYQVGLALFLVLGFTDALDGSLARVRRQISEWGIRFDPVADKIFIGSVLVVIVLKHINIYLGVALLFVEAASIVGGWWRWHNGKVDPANRWGKAKMFFEVVGLAGLILAGWLGVDLLSDLSTSTLGLALLAAIISVYVRIK